MRGFAMLEDEHKLVLAPIKRSHSGIMLDPNADIFELGIDLRTRGNVITEAGR